ncbi:MAG: hydrogen peroxide-dependent heme synthase [Verrucomicrobiaceae bacterium]
MSESPAPLVPKEGWHVMHLYYSVDHSQWGLLSDSEKREAKTRLTGLVQEIRSTPHTQLLIFAVATPKADIGFMLLTPDLHDATAFEKQLTLSLGADVLTPTYSYLSQTERSEYTTTREQYGKDTLVGEEGLTEGSPEYEEKLTEFDTRMEHYLKHRMYPVLPDWPAICFYPMSKRRATNPDYNWYSLEHDARAKLMKGHATTGRKYSGKILQLITGSTGLDEHEWGVTLLAHDTIEIKNIVYEMRFDEVSARYAEFGDFYIGMQLPLDQLFERVCL